jgi:hypothetical protein
MVFAHYISENKKVKKKSCYTHGSKPVCQIVQAIASPQTLLLQTVGEHENNGFGTESV